MWNTSEFGSFGKQPAGGFSVPQSGGFLNTSTNSPSSVEKKKPERLSNVMACTIAQIHRMSETDENVKVGSMSARIVKLVGLLQSVDVQSTKVTFVVNDMTGPSIEVQVWLGENEEVEKKLHSVRENTYVQVMGAVRSIKGRRHVIAFKVTPIKEVNEITMHILEVVHTSMSIALMDKQGSDHTPDLSGINTATPSFGSSTNTAFGGKETNTAFGGKDSIVPHGAGGLSKPQQIVFQAITASTGTEGVSVNDLCSSIKSLNRAQIKNVVEFLSNEGHIYSTVDDEHYKSTESM